MSVVDKSGLAFPVSDLGVHVSCGMSLRDWFAGLALQGICASGPGSDWSNTLLAQEAYQLADAMLTTKENKS